MDEKIRKASNYVDKGTKRLIKKDIKRDKEVSKSHHSVSSKKSLSKPKGKRGS